MEPEPVTTVEAGNIIIRLVAEITKMPQEVRSVLMPLARDAMTAIVDLMDDEGELSWHFGFEDGRAEGMRAARGCTCRQTCHAHRLETK